MDKESIEAIQLTWSDEGFFGKLREGVFDHKLFIEVKFILAALNFEEHETIPRSIISNLWFMPVFMYRQKGYVENIGSDEYDSYREDIEESLVKIFGYPDE